MLRFLESMQWVLFIFFTAAYAYQIFYLLVGLWGKQRGGVENAELHRYAAIISARNESAVIGRLIRTLKEQDYRQICSMSLLLQITARTIPLR